MAAKSLPVEETHGVDIGWPVTVMHGVDWWSATCPVCHADLGFFPTAPASEELAAKVTQHLLHVEQVLLSVRAVCEGGD